MAVRKLHAKKRKKRKGHIKIQSGRYPFWRKIQIYIKDKHTYKKVDSPNLVLARKKKDFFFPKIISDAITFK